jgi:hypothetical protein
LRSTDPSLTAIDLASFDCADSIDIADRAGRRSVLHRHRVQNLKLALEIDGRRHETDEDLFESDRWRQNALVAGWRVLRFTWRMLQEHPDVFIAAIRAELH